jgi:hypothetical protein
VAIPSRRFRTCCQPHLQGSRNLIGYFGFLTLEDGTVPISCHETSIKNCHCYCITAQKSAVFNKNMFCFRWLNIMLVIIFKLLKNQPYNYSCTEIILHYAHNFNQNLQYSALLIPQQMCLLWKPLLLHVLNKFGCQPPEDGEVRASNH